MSSEKTFLTALFLLALVLFLIGCAQQQDGADVTQQPQEQALPSEQPSTQEQPAAVAYSMEEIANHNSKDDCWLLINGKVYDVTKSIGSHPGGLAILEGCGKDAADLFETRPMGSGTPHSEKAREYLAKSYIGDLQQ